MQDCVLTETDDDTFTLKLSSFATDQISALTFRRNQMRTHYISFEANPALKDLELRSQHLFNSSTGLLTDPQL